MSTIHHKGTKFTSTTTAEADKIVGRLWTLGNLPTTEFFCGALNSAQAAGCNLLQGCDFLMSQEMKPKWEIEVEITRGTPKRGGMRSERGTLYRFQISSVLGIFNVSRFHTLYRTPCHQELGHADLDPIGNREVIDQCLADVVRSMVGKPGYVFVTANFRKVVTQIS